MRFFDYQFTPRLWAVVLYAALLSCMLWLGNWQLNRAALKVSMAEAAEASRRAPAIPLTNIEDIEAAAASYTRVSMQGEYDGTRQLLWDNRTHKGQAGFEVLVPLQLEGGQWVLVNRGWIAPGPSRAQLPTVSLPETASERSVAIEGFLSRPSKGFASGEALPEEGEWPQLLQYLDYQAIEKVLGVPLLPVLVQAQTLAEDGSDRTVLTARPEWLIANWQPSASGPAKHYSYAFQWFAMALALTIIFVVVNTRKSRTGSDQRKPS
ncbi:SURF1 family protein [Granulosicoccus sp. 3-233]|uniref:SURF1 family protein n=1 Tax=Granulosicoccus sp. 3-233 TaxID=3417969 RepID=UPI003D337ED5